MIAWTIEACLKSRYIDRTFVSTEDPEIKEVALKYGAEVVDRPAELSQGQISINYAYSHFKYCLWEMKYQPDYAILLLPTSPLRAVEHIDEAFKLYFESDKTLLMSVTEANIASTHLHTISESGKLTECLLDGHAMRDNVKKPTMYWANSAIGISPFRNAWTYLELNNSIPLNDHIIPYIMKPEDSIDVDYPFDFKVAEMLLKERMKGGEKK